MKKNKKVIILGTIGTVGLVAATVIPIVLINQKKDEKVEKDIVVYSNKLKTLSTKSVKIIALNTESITDKKVEILAAIKLLTNFPKPPTGITLEVKEDSTKIVNNKEIDITLIVKKEGETNIEVEGFKVKSFTDQEIVNNYIDKLKAFSTKEVQIASKTGTITSKKSEIITSIKGLENFPELPDGVTLDLKNDSTALRVQEIPIILIVKKGLVDKEVQGFSASRSATDQEKVNIYKTIVLAQFTIFDQLNPNLKYLKIDNAGSVTDNKNAILAKIKKYGDTSSISNENVLLNNVALALVGIELDIKNDSTTITKEGIPITVQLKKGTAVAEFDGAGGSFQFFVKRTLTNAESVTEIKNYLSSINDKIFVSNSAPTSIAEEILTAIKQSIGDNAAEETKNLFTIKADQPTSLTEGQETSIEYDFGSETLTLLVTKRTSDAQAIIDYFAQSGKTDLSIPDATVISNKASLTSAIQEALGTDDSALFDNTKKAYVTVASDYTYSAFTKGVAKNVKVKIQKGAETPEFITLSITHLKDHAAIIRDYFSTSGNDKIFISHSVPTSTAEEILTAIKDALGTNLDDDQKNLITLSQYTALVEGTETSINFGVIGGDDVTLLVTKRTNDAQAIIDYFAQSGKTNLSIPSATVISDKVTLTSAIQEALGTDDSALFDNTKKVYVTVASDYTYSTFTKGTAKEVKVKIQKGAETPEFITLSVMHNTSDFEEVISYFSTSREFFIPHSTRTSSAGEIFNASIMNAIPTGLNGLSNVQKNLIDNTPKPNPVTSLVDGEKTSITYIVDGGRGEITFSITKRSGDAQAIIDYFAQSGKTDLSIPNATVVSNKTSLTSAIQEALKLDDSVLFDDTKKVYVTVASDYTYSAFTKGIAKDVEVKIQKGAEEPEFITLSITHLKDHVAIIRDYFSTSENDKIFISHSVSTSTAEEILTAVKDALGTNLDDDQKNLITLSQYTALVEGTETSINFGVIGGDDVTLLVTKRTNDAQAIIDYFAQSGKTNLSIPSATVISDKVTLTSAIQEALGTDDSALFDNTKKVYVTVASDYTYSTFTKGTAKDVKVKIQKGAETPEFITLSVTHLE